MGKGGKGNAKTRAGMIVDEYGNAVLGTRTRSLGNVGVKGD